MWGFSGTRSASGSASRATDGAGGGDADSAAQSGSEATHVSTVSTFIASSAAAPPLRNCAAAASSSSSGERSGHLRLDEWAIRFKVRAAHPGASCFAAIFLLPRPGHAKQPHHYYVAHNELFLY